ncbi:Holliday junction ATP-dependent DNA helicase RuvA [Mycoplasmopsis agalactiae]|uniref:Holliday junction branch migration complex subunit RuvA n=1 Tax=Mycoplasmopsis agalactiae (strain NCTC 10123 / CIP 59.7 / PG2) TaxID=347257 RepID=RUVA_MYCAP|nr:Holliday junction branch migration protein RuvA [Mycoplasmopsis agalactiae]A5IY12.1 RecName: Full=Holliday junction branch migration complex subunit RuvA [Mycoplasmopsis agalactiae PG2]MCE6057005.1 Holliday junction branch migration protein RuvA [Mycoplasmopsis agalactiae]MCE6078792.1 Holliday junction branch migration protein RuvA [Mycoplasmopsis agalactiae]MCE6095175.1 Holliday junction branch migration protein RuvA [Mycoplasmopsis agalactiae]MCE6114430.1 Holliday junction branch migratio
MILYRIGEIIHKHNSNIIFESQGIGYSLILPDPERVEIKQKCKLYLFEIKNEYQYATYAFKDFKERLLFVDLISLNGIGPRAAFNILNFGFEKVVALIAEGNAEALIEIPYLNPRMARLIVAELQAKWSKMISPKDAAKINETTNTLSEVKETLKMVGFKTKQIDGALSKISSTDDVEKMIEEAIKLMSTQNYESATA